MTETTHRRWHWLFCWWSPIVNRYTDARLTSIDLNYVKCRLCHKFKRVGSGYVERLVRESI